jgi:glucose-1-phosphate adenylyltransferase
MDNVNIGPRARIHRATIDKNVHIAADQTVGCCLEADRQQYNISANGIVIISKAPETPETRERDL